MTVGQLIALLQNAAIDPFGQIVFKDNSGVTFNMKLTNYGPVEHLNPAQPTDPSYCELKLVP